MSADRLRQGLARLSSKLSFKTVLLIPFVLQLAGTSLVIGYLSYRDEQHALQLFAHEMMQEMGDRTQQHLQSYTQLAQKIARLVADDLELDLIRLDAPDLSALDAYFLRRSREFQEVSFIYVGNQDGKFIGAGPTLQNGAQAYIVEVTDQTTEGHYVSFATNPQGDRTHQINAVPNYDPRRRPWYQAAVAAQAPTWSPIYPFIGEANEGLTITAVVPFYQAEGRLEGVTAVDLYLADIHQFLKRLTLRDAGQVFIMEPTGLLVATSSDQPPVIVQNNSLERVSVHHSPDVLTRAIADRLRQAVGSFDQLQTPYQLEMRWQRDLYFVRVMPWRDAYGLNWLVVTALPRSSLLTHIDRQTRKTLWLSLGALIGSLWVGLLIVRWVAEPISQLSRASRQAAQGHWHPAIAIDRSDELGDLARSFNQMTAQLHQSLIEMESLNKALTLSEQRWRQFLEALSVGVAVHDATGKLIFVNQTAMQLLGVTAIPTLETPTQTMSATYNIYRADTDQLYPDDELPAFRSLRGESVWLDDLVIRGASGDRWFEARSRPIWGAEGTIDYAVVAFFDITTRKQVERILEDYNRHLEAQVTERTQALREQQAFLQQILDAMPSSVFVKDLEGRILLANRAAAVIHGIEAEAMIGKWEWEFNPNCDRRQVEEFLAENREVISLLKPAIFSQAIVDFQGQLRWYQTLVSPFLDTTGQVKGIIGNCIDISERKRAEEAREQSEAKMRAILAAIPDLLFHLSADGHYLGCIKANHPIDILPVGFDPVGKHITTFLPAEMAKRHLHYMEQALKTQTMQVYEQEHWMGDKHQYEEVRVVPYCDNAVLFMVRDISERKQAEDERHRAEEALKQANHELGRLATLDSLTQIANRRQFETYFRHEWGRLARDQQPLTLILFDVDYFKRFNDCYGHLVGDQCLIQIAQVASQAVKRSTDLVARYGGEEFVVVLPNTTLAGGIRVAEMIQVAVQALAIPHRQSEVSSIVTVSLGVASVVPLVEANPDDLLALTDQALYRAKQQGRNCYVCCPESAA